MNTSRGQLLQILLSADPEDIWDWCKPPAAAIVLSSVNCICLETNLEEVLQNEADFVFLQEHSAAPSKVSALKGMCEEVARECMLGSLDPNVISHNLGGVGAIAPKHRHRLIYLKPVSPEFREAELNGRAIHFGAGTAGGDVISVFVVYGFSGGAGNNARASPTDALISAILKEWECSPIGPCAILGDINCDPEHLKTLRNMLGKECWTDVGAVADRWNQLAQEHTCTVAGATIATRRDYIFTNSYLTPRIRNFRVVHDNRLPLTQLWTS